MSEISKNPDFVLNNKKPLNTLYKTPHSSNGGAVAKFSVGPNAQANIAKKAAVPKKKDIWGIEKNPNALNKVRNYKYNFGKTPAIQIQIGK